MARHPFFVPSSWIIAILAMMIYSDGYSQVGYKRSGDYYALCKDSIPVTPYVYTEVSAFSEGRAWVNKGDLYGYIDTNLNSITSFQFTDVAAFQNGFAVVSRDSLFGYIDRLGNDRSKFVFQEALSINCALGIVRDSLGWLVLDTFGQQISDIRFDVPPYPLSNNFILISDRGKWGVMNRKGVLIHPFMYDLITVEGVAYKGQNKIYLGLF